MDQILQLALKNGRVKGVQRGESGRNGSNSPIQLVLNNGGVKGVGGVEMDQIFQLVLNNWGVKGVGGVEMDQLLQLVLNDGGGEKKNDQILPLVFNI